MHKNGSVAAMVTAEYPVTPRHITTRFYIWYAIAAVLGITFFILTTVWSVNYQNGLSWSTSKMNLHPYLLMLGLIIFYSQSILVYRLGRGLPKMTLKIIHMSLNLAAFVLAVVGLHAAFLFRSDMAGFHLYSLHSWFGIITITLFTAQFVSGFCTYLFPGLPMSFRAMLMPLHKNAGIGIFILALITSATGYMIKGLLAVSDYMSKSSEGYLVNFTTLVLIMFGILVVYLVNTPEYRRLPLRSD